MVEYELIPTFHLTHFKLQLPNMNGKKKRKMCFGEPGRRLINISEINIKLKQVFHTI